MKQNFISLPSLPNSAQINTSKLILYQSLLSLRDTVFYLSDNRLPDCCLSTTAKIFQLSSYDLFHKTLEVFKHLFISGITQPILTVKHLYSKESIKETLKAAAQSFYREGCLHTANIKCISHKILELQRNWLITAELQVAFNVEADPEDRKLMHFQRISTNTAGFCLTIPCPSSVSVSPQSFSCCSRVIFYLDELISIIHEGPLCGPQVGLS